MAKGNIEQVKRSCIGCGVCAVVCPVSCIGMVYTSYKEYRPVVQLDECLSCGECLRYCTQAAANKQREYDEVRTSRDAIAVGLTDATYYLARYRRNIEILKSCSGGVATALACRLLEAGSVTAVIHAERLLNRRGAEHYRVRISRTTQEMRAHRGSLYGPLCFREAFSGYRGQSENLLLIGTPCIIRAAHKLFHEHPQFRKNRLLTIALICSHNVSGAFTDFIGDSLHIATNAEYYADMRHKDRSIPDRNHYRICYYDKGGTMADINRYTSIYTRAWRAYFFAWESCLVCSDFWGRLADISLKDSWGRCGRLDRYGSNIVISRSPDIDAILHDMDELRCTKLSYRTVYNCQTETAIYKQRRLALNADFLGDATTSRYLFHLRVSKALYQKYGYLPTKWFLESRAFRFLCRYLSLRGGIF